MTEDKTTGDAACASLALPLCMSEQPLDQRTANCGTRDAEALAHLEDTSCSTSEESKHQSKTSSSTSEENQVHSQDSTLAVTPSVDVWQTNLSSLPLYTGDTLPEHLPSSKQTKLRKDYRAMPPTEEW